MIQRHRADGFQVPVEHGIDDDRSKTFPGEIGKPRPHRIGTAGKHRKLDEPDFGLALPRQHPHQIGIVHRIERMILQRAFIQRHRADE